MSKSYLIVGGGHGLSGLLTGLLSVVNPSTVEWQVGVGMTDHGGSSGLLRDQYDVPALGDWRRCLTAVSEPAQQLGFERRDEKGHALGNLYLLKRLQSAENSLVRVSRALNQDLETQILIWPLTLGQGELVLMLESGASLIGEGRIGAQTQSDPIRQLRLQPDLELHPHIIDALASTDGLIIAPGSFWSSQIAAILPSACAQRIKERGADWPIIYLANVAHERGETPHLDLVDQVELLSQYLGRSPSVVLANQELRRFDQDLSPLGAVRHLVPPQPIEWQRRLPETELVLAKLLHQRSDLEHDHRQLAKELVKILSKLVLPANK